MQGRAIRIEHGCWRRERDSNPRWLSPRLFSSSVRPVRGGLPRPGAYWAESSGVRPLPQGSVPCVTRMAHGCRHAGGPTIREVKPWRTSRWYASRTGGSTSCCLAKLAWGYSMTRWVSPTIMSITNPGSPMVAM
jgi:hypothetical protein